MGDGRWSTVRVMARLCERPGCSTLAEVAYGFDAEQLVVWLDGFHAAQGARSGVLCLRHADAMVVPLGWMLDDRRELVPRLFKSPADTVARVRSRRPRVDADSTIEQLRLDAAVLVGVPDDDLDASDTGRRLPDLGSDSDSAPAAQLSDSDADTGGDTASDMVDPVAPWQPHFDETDDLEGLLKARGRLLSRAFNGITQE